MNIIETIERWTGSPDNPRYEISSRGRVRNKKRGNIIKQKITTDGYHRVCLSESGYRNGKSWSVARLVAKAFIPNPKNLPPTRDSTSGSKLGRCSKSNSLLP